MKYLLKNTGTTSRIAGLLTIGMMCLAFSLDGFACHKGTPHGRNNDCGGDPPPPEEEAVTLAITYEFGTPTGGSCSAPECLTTSITATGTVECTNLLCDFTSTSVSDVFNLPSGLRELLLATEWRRTLLDPDACFGSSPAAPGSGAALIEATPIFLRRFNDEVTPWSAKVDAMASDVEGVGVRQYGFNFQGCGPDTCGDFAPGSMAGTYEGGDLTAINVPGNDRKFPAIPCRCTRSNTPDCPGDVPVPTPPMRITVSEVP